MASFARTFIRGARVRSTKLGFFLQKGKSQVNKVWLLLLRLDEKGESEVNKVWLLLLGPPSERAKVKST